MSVYLDTSVLVAMFSDDAFTERVDTFLRDNADELMISDFAAAEFASAVARKVRTRRLTEGEARTAFANFDLWTARAVGLAETTSDDIAAAASFLRRLDLNLRTPDAINIAVARRVGADLATFDDRMAANARALGSPVAAI